MCPVQCIYEYNPATNILFSEEEAGSGVMENSHTPNPDMIAVFVDTLLYVNVDECTSCTACYQPDVCPVGAIYSEEQVPDSSHVMSSPTEAPPDRQRDHRTHSSRARAGTEETKPAVLPRSYTWPVRATEATRRRGFRCSERWNIMRLVLVGDDGSLAAARAVTWATRFAGERDAHVMVVHVTVSGDDIPAKDDGVEHVVIRESHPASAIMQAAADLDADVVVLGRRGTGGFPSLPIGTTVHSVAGACGRTVVVVPAVDFASREALVQRVVVGLDGLAGSASAAAWAARHFEDAHITAVHALEHLPALAGDDAQSDALYEHAQERATELIRDYWSGPLRAAGAEFDLVTDHGDSADVILATAASVAADLVVVGRQDRGSTCGLLGGVSQRVLAQAPCAAAIVQSSPD